MEELLMVERAAFQNLPEIAKVELYNNPRLSYMDPQAFRSVIPAFHSGMFVFPSSFRGVASGACSHVVSACSSFCYCKVK